MIVLFFNRNHQIGKLDMSKKTGKTTRLVDRSIQELFGKGITYLYDGRSNFKNEHDKIISIFNNRIKLEHPNTKYTYTYGCFDRIYCYKIELHNL